jgi:anti-sigma-K factor RskA
MRRLSRDLAHALAAEYVLGTLRGRARARFEAVAREDAQVAAIVRSWEDAMTPLAERVPPVEPPARVWRAIESRLAPAPTRPATGLWSSLLFWRNLGIAASGLAVILLAAFLSLPPRPMHEPMMVAVLSANDAAPRAVAMLEAPDLLRVRIVKPWGNMEGLSLELWALPREGAPRSLGLVANASDRETLIKLAERDTRLRDVKALAVTMEPVGGSPTRQPTGSPVCSGAVAPMRRT